MKFCHTQGARLLVEQMHFSANSTEVELWLTQAEEARNLLAFDSAFDWHTLSDFTPFIPGLRIDGSYLLEDQFTDLRSALQAMGKLFAYLRNRKENAPHLFAIVSKQNYARPLEDAINRVLDDAGLVRANASKELLSISSKLSAAQQEARARLERIFKQARENSFAANTGITIRDGRLVLPILAEHKRKIPGFVHDESSTGQTLYIEPAEVLELNNEVRELELARRREIVRILIDLSTLLRPYIPLLEVYDELAAMLDFINAKAHLALRYDCHKPIVRSKPGIKLANARHPLLWLRLKAKKIPLVPLHLMLDAEQRILIISGPNAGGKSISLKTIGLLQLMVQYGLLVPADPHSEFGIFTNIMVDIGDQQSVENDLSTYSSHLTNMRHFLAVAHQSSLFLIDEFGTGTDPAFGGPIAEAVLEELARQGAFGVVTTHYGNLKLLAGNTPGVANAAMGFNTETLQPQFKLSVGAPGSSFALEIARNTGLPLHVMAAAGEKIGRQQKGLDELLLELQTERKQLDDMKRLSAIKDDLLADVLSRTQKKEEELKAQKAKIMAEARLQASALVGDANRKIEKAIRDIRESQAEADVAKVIRKEISDLRQALAEPVEVPPTPQEAKILEGQLAKGDMARRRGSTMSGPVLELQKHKALVELGAIKMWMPVSELEKVEGAAPATKASGGYSNYVTEAVQEFSPTLDVRGMRVSEIQGELDQFFDRALLSGVSSVVILHGKGNGTLRRFIREDLRRRPHVADFQAGHADRGGEGLTEVTLK